MAFLCLIARFAKICMITHYMFRVGTEDAILTIWPTFVVAFVPIVMTGFFGHISHHETLTSTALPRMDSSQVVLSRDKVTSGLPVGAALAHAISPLSALHSAVPRRPMPTSRLVR